MNDDLISRKAVLKQIRKIECEPGYQHVGEDWSVGLCIAESIVEEAESVTNPDDVVELPSMSLWIPVSERLPDIGEHYVSEVCLCYCSNGAYCFGELEANIFGQVGWDCERDDDYHEAVGEVVAWMPLPPKYEG